MFNKNLEPELLKNIPKKEYQKIAEHLIKTIIYARSEKTMKPEIEDEIILKFISNLNKDYNDDTDFVENENKKTKDAHEDIDELSEIIFYKLNDEGNPEYLQQLTLEGFNNYMGYVRNEVIKAMDQNPSLNVYDAIDEEIKKINKRHDQPTNASPEIYEKERNARIERFYKYGPNNYLPEPKYEDVEDDEDDENENVDETIDNLPDKNTTEKNLSENEKIANEVANKFVNDIFYQVLNKINKGEISNEELSEIIDDAINENPKTLSLLDSQTLDSEVSDRQNNKK
jgi:hypothetical protein